MTEKLAARPHLGSSAGLAALAAAQLAIVLQSWSTSTTMPAIVTALELSPTQAAWVTNAYLLTFGGLLLLGGRIADRRGGRAGLLAGFGLFAAGSLLAGGAADFAQLVAGRAVQGVGAALAAPAALALLAELFAPGAERARALGVWGTAAVAGAPLGTLAGGLLAQELGWSAALLTGVPLCAAGAALAVVALPPSRGRSGGTLDVVGAVCATAAIGALLLSATSFADGERTGAAVALAVASALTMLFALAERRAADPLLPPRFVRSRAVLPANLVALLGDAAHFGGFFFLVLYARDRYGLEPAGVGLAFLPYALALLPGTRLAGVLLATRAGRTVLLLGCGGVAAGLALLAATVPGAPYVLALLPAMVLLGIGGGLFLVALNAVALERAEPGRTGLVSGLLGTSQEVGGALGLTCAATVFVAATPAGGALDGYRVVFAVTAVLALAALACAAAAIDER